MLKLSNINLIIIILAAAQNLFAGLPPNESTNAPECQQLESNIHLEKAIAAGNYGITLLVDVGGRKEALKVTKGNVDRETKVGLELSELGESLNIPLYLKNYSSFKCSCNNLPPSWKSAIKEKQQASGKLGIGNPEDPKTQSEQCTFIRLELLDKSVLDVKRENPDFFRANPNFVKSLMFQILFAYEVAHRELGFLHCDANDDNYGLLCSGKQEGQSCKANPSESVSTQWCFELDKKVWCFKAQDSQNYYLKLIDFGQSGTRSKPFSTRTTNKICKTNFRQDASSTLGLFNGWMRSAGIEAPDDWETAWNMAQEKNSWAPVLHSSIFANFVNQIPSANKSRFFKINK